MSKFSGKCDVFDWFGDDSDEFITNSNIKIRETTLNIKNRKDLIPYYPYLVASGGRDKNKCTVFLTEKSYIDIEEEESLKTDLKSLLDYYDKTKDKYDENEAYKIIQPFGWNRKYSHELVKRVKEYGHDATIEGLHDPTHERYRQEFCDYMIKNGYDAEFAFQTVYKERWDDKIREKKEKKNATKK